MTRTVTIKTAELSPEQNLQQMVTQLEARGYTVILDDGTKPAEPPATPDQEAPAP